MSDQLLNFRSWYSDILRDLSRQENAGLAMLMIAFPLLERYLREKSGAQENNHPPEAFFVELRKIFPVLSDNSIARKFWADFRQGLLREVTLTQQPSELGASSHQTAALLTVDAAAGRFELCPALFVGKVIETIEADFRTFEGKDGLYHSPAKVHVSNIGVSGGKVEAPITSNGSGGGMRVIFNSSAHSPSRLWTLPYPKELGMLLMVLASLTILIAHAGFGIPVIMEITRVFESPDETIDYQSSVIHWFFIIEAIVFAVGSGLVIYSLFTRKQADTSPPRQETGERN
jgi:hypothetical protein